MRRKKFGSGSGQRSGVTQRVQGACHDLNSSARFVRGCGRRSLMRHSCERGKCLGVEIPALRISFHSHEGHSAKIAMLIRNPAGYGADMAPLGAIACG